MPSYDLFVYYDMDDATHDSPPSLGEDAGRWFGNGFEGLHVTAITPGMHAERVTVVLAREIRPEMHEEMKAYFTPR
jgi:hypothetical protein